MLPMPRIRTLPAPSTRGPGQQNHPTAQLGLGLLEVLVALFIGVFLLTGALTIYSNGRGTIEVTARINRMQESGRYALEMMEPDVRGAGYWGTLTSTDFVAGRAGPGDPVTIDVINDCENNWAINLDRPVEGSDNANPFPASCLSGIDTYAAGTDTLVLRRAGGSPVATVDLQPATLYLRADESRAELFIGTTEPPGFSPTAQNYPLVTHAYYISPTSDLDPNVPSLRRLVLDNNGVDPFVTDEELVSGAEDLQVQWGLDTDADGSVNSYVDPNPLVDLAAVLSVRLWLRMRTTLEEDGFVDNASYVYADVDYTPEVTLDQQDERFRRLLVSKTVSLRNRVVELNDGL
jgi:type IV pilus assembly protein PilW